MNKQEFLKVHPPDYSGAGRLVEILDMNRRLIMRGMESVKMGKIPPDHCNYLANFLETKMIPLLEEIVRGLQDKASSGG